MKLPQIFSTSIIYVLASAAFVCAQTREGAVEQFRSFAPTQNMVPEREYIGRIGVISAYALFYGSVFESGGTGAVEEEYRDCYERANKGEMMAAYAACYVSDLTFLAILESAGTQNEVMRSIAETYKIEMENRFSSNMSNLSIIPDMQDYLRTDFEQTQQIGMRWIEARTLGQINSCFEAGVGTDQCP
jgi:hypothetical protein